MLKRIWERFTVADNHEEARLAIANQILNRLTVHGRLTLDDATLADMGLSGKQAYDAAYHLVLAERLQMRAGPTGKLELLSNEEFERMTLIEIKVPEVEPASADTAAAPARVEDALPYLPETDAVPEAASAPVGASTDIPLLKVLPEHTRDGEEPLLWDAGLATLSLPVNRELDWFNLDVAPAETAAAADEARQTLPKRKREAWVVAAEELAKTAD